MLHEIGAVVTAATLVFPSCEVSSAVQPMTDAFRLLCTCVRLSGCPRVSVPKSFNVCVCVCAGEPVCKCVRLFPLQHTDIIKQLAQSFQPQQGQIIQSALSSNTVWIHY